MLEKSSWKQVLLSVFKAAFVVLVLSSMYVPVVLIMYQSFNAGANSISPLSWGGFTWKNYAEIFTNRQLYTSILDSLLVSFWATVFATVGGLFASIGIHALEKKARKTMDFHHARLLFGQTDFPSYFRLCLHDLGPRFLHDSLCYFDGFAKIRANG